MIRRFLHMLRYVRPYWKIYLVGTLALLFVNLLDTSMPRVLQWAIDHLRFAADGKGTGGPLGDWLPAAWLSRAAPLSGMWVYCALYVLLMALTGFFRYWMSIAYSQGTVSLTNDLRNKLFAHVQRLPASYHDHRKIGSQMSLATNDMDTVRMFYGFGLLLLVDVGLYFVFVPLHMFSISWKLALASIAPMPFIPLVVSRLWRKIEERYERVQEQFETLAERSRESYAGAKVIKAFTREENEVRSFAKLCREYTRRGLKLIKIQALQHPLLMLFFGLTDLVVVLYGGHLCLKGEISPGEFFAFFQYLLRQTGPMIAFGMVISFYQRGSVSLARIEEVLHTRSDIVDATGATARGNNGDPQSRPVGRVDEGPSGDIELRRLTYTYPGETRPALTDVSLTLPAGKTLAVVGPVGSGKTTLANLIPRLYDPPPGTVLLDDRDAREWPLATLRTRIGVVPQENTLFSETIRENIAIGIVDERIDDDWLRECSRIAQFEEEALRFPKGYDTLLGENGVNLSGGQRQRVAIARALARRPAILILDDCLSAVDAHTEKEILAGLHRVMRRSTTIIISHRMSTVERADEILVLDQGRVAERGTHRELLAHDGYYAKLHRMQRLEEAIAAE